MNKRKYSNPPVNMVFIEQDFDIQTLDHPFWQKANSYITQHDYSGKLAPVDQHFETRLLWSNKSLYVRFDAQIDPAQQPLNVNDDPQWQQKTMALWERDVCELFLAPDKNNCLNYFEFEVAPTAEWIDLKISHQTINGERQRITDWDFQSGMQAAANIGNQSTVSAFKVDWKNLQQSAQKGDVYCGNFFRALGKEPHRHYLAWSPTQTDEPNFHVPECFVELVLK